ncbi:hypothetical protein NPIL_632501 [Nephila pilipes]|uniref:Uncharacterized protein n=1 Tax=Nephila pilipes TaxID=299642 RepID=A0A8X6QG86_NEPPI|nr:hypothetical protein NPIL_632501 [Nephila pilipes]
MLNRHIILLKWKLEGNSTLMEAFQDMEEDVEEETNNCLIARQEHQDMDPEVGEEMPKLCCSEVEEIFLYIPIIDEEMVQLAGRGIEEKLEEESSSF